MRSLVHLIVILCLVGLLLHALLVVPSSESFFTPLYLSGPTKCFSCERDMIARNGGDPSYAWMGKPSKCFDCEQQLAAVDPNLANLTHGTKCFGCEEQSRATCGI